MRRDEEGRGGISSKGNRVVEDAAKKRERRGADGSELGTRGWHGGKRECSEQTCLRFKIKDQCPLESI